MCRIHLDRKVHTAENLSDLFKQGIGRYLETPQNKGKGSGRVPKMSTKITFTTKSVTKQGSSVQQQEVDKDSRDMDTREDRNNQQGQRTGGNDVADSGSDTSRHRGSSSSSSMRRILQRRKNNQ